MRLESGRFSHGIEALAGDLLKDITGDWILILIFYLAFLLSCKKMTYYRPIEFLLSSIPVHDEGTSWAAVIIHRSSVMAID